MTTINACKWVQKSPLNRDEITQFTKLPYESWDLKFLLVVGDPIPNPATYHTDSNKPPRFLEGPNHDSLGIRRDYEIQRQLFKGKSVANSANHFFSKGAQYNLKKGRVWGQIQE